MVFSSIHNWSPHEELTSTQINQVNTDITHAVDKTDESQGSGGGISGRVDFLSGSACHIQSGSHFFGDSGSTSTLSGSASFFGTTGLFGTTLVQVYDTTSNYAVDTAQPDTVILVDTTSAGVTITLPAIGGVSGRVLTIKDFGGQAGVSGHYITINAGSGQTIQGGSSAQITTAYGWFTYVSTTGTAWYIIGNGP